MSLGKNELKKDYVYRKIMEMINSNAVTDGRFPSEPEFCKLFNVSRVTLRSALKRLEKEGIISRSQYHGTRLVQNSSAPRFLISRTPAHFSFSDRKTREGQYIEACCRERKIACDFCEPCFLQDPRKLAEKYSGVILSGAAIRGDEPFMDVLRQSGLPIVYCREDEQNIITDTIASVGVNMKKAFLAGIEHLAQLGFRRIMVLISDDERTFQRLGFTRQLLKNVLLERGLASDMIFHHKDNDLKEKIRDLAPEAVFCYSDYEALAMYKILKEMGQKIPQDIAVLGFGCGSDLVTPSLSSVSLVPPLFGTAVVSLLERLIENPDMKPPQLDLPFSIFSGESTAKMNLNNLLEK